MDNVLWVMIDGENRLVTENLVTGNKTYKEKLISMNKREYRTWDPYRSKLAASIIKKLNASSIKNGSSVLYLGASTGTTVSHISDIVGTHGKIFAVEHSSRVAREFIHRVALHRSNIFPIMEDARHPQKYFSIYEKVDIVYSDIAQQNQTEIAIINCRRYLKKNGYLFLVIKTRSIDVTKEHKKIVTDEIKKLKRYFLINQRIDLQPYDRYHSMVLAKFL